MEEKIKKILDQIPVRTDTLITGFQLLLCIIVLFFAAKQQIASDAKLAKRQQQYTNKLEKKLMKQRYLLEKQNYKIKITDAKARLHMIEQKQKARKYT
ncbi:hypothetical protein NDGK_01003 [Clostridiales bacterium CHKCI001]|nr:hypothetical protein NDGK_01003 [Clostridiales bacterium CHKCI001]